MRFRNRYCLIECLFLTLIGLAVVYQLFVPPMVGLANSGDFSRITGWFGLSCGNGVPEEIRYLFINKEYAWDPTVKISYPSSALFFLGSALAGNLVVRGSDIFDIRLLGGVYVAYFLLSMLILTYYTRTLPPLRRLLLYALIIFIFADVGYIAYFHSFYSEPASFISICATLAFALAAVARSASGRPASPMIAGFFVSSIFLITAKTQNIPMALPVAVFGYYLSRRCPANGSNVSRRRKVAHLVLPALLIFIAGGCYIAYSEFSDKIKPMNRYHVVFHEILGHSTSPEDDAVELGLDPELAIFAGTIPSSPGVPQELVADLPNRVGYKAILRFYLRHPDRLFDLAERAADEAFHLRPTYLGNFERSHVLIEGEAPVAPSMFLPPDYLSYKFALWSSLKEATLPQSIWLLVIFLAINIAAILVKRIKYDRSPTDRTVTDLHAMIVVSAAMQFFVVILGDGDYDIVKHLFLFNMLCEVCLVFLIMYAAGAGYLLKRGTVKQALEIAQT